jgi:DNA processing protein
MTFPDELPAPIITLHPADTRYSQVFAGIDPPVKTLYICSDNLEDLFTHKRVAVIGSRRMSPYGRAVTYKIAGDLARKGIIIVSGLAYGIDSIAHQAALDAGGLTIAVLPGSLQQIYPRVHANLAKSIVRQGGALITEYPAGSEIAYKNQFLERNRIIAGMCDAILVTEAAVDSGTIGTAEKALGKKDVFAIPGNVTSPLSEGTNNLIKSDRAAAATSANDILKALDLPAIEPPFKPRGGSANEQLLLDLMQDTVTDGGKLLEESRLPVAEFNQALTMMELTGKIRPLGNNLWHAS